MEAKPPCLWVLKRWQSKCHESSIVVLVKHSRGVYKSTSGLSVCQTTGEPAVHVWTCVNSLWFCVTYCISLRRSHSRDRPKPISLVSAVAETVAETRDTSLYDRNWTLGRTCRLSFGRNRSQIWKSKAKLLQLRTVTSCELNIYMYCVQSHFKLSAVKLSVQLRLP